MTGLSEILHRFRFHGVPGAPGAVAVPADRAAGTEAELAPVFAALEDAQRACAEMVGTAEGEARRRRATALEDSRRMIERARSAAAGERAEAASAQLAIAQEECVEVLAESRREAERVARVAEERMPTLVEHVVAEVFALVGRASPLEEPAK